MKPFSYAKREIPSEYRCAGCQVHGVKLWRTRHIDTLWCSIHAGRIAGYQPVVDANGSNRHRGDVTDQIGPLVPAIPTEDGSSFWGYTSVPEEGISWWRSLMSMPVDCDHTDSPVCPYCGHEQTDTQEMRDDRSSWTCEACDRDFELAINVSVTYSTRTKEGSDG